MPFLHVEEPFLDARKAYSIMLFVMCWFIVGYNFVLRNVRLLCRGSLVDCVVNIFRCSNGSSDVWIGMFIVLLKYEVIN